MTDNASMSPIERAVNIIGGPSETARKMTLATGKLFSPSVVWHWVAKDHVRVEFLTALSRLSGIPVLEFVDHLAYTSEKATV
jgi:hypothetical protein